jgi:hypothetical protein
MEQNALWVQAAEREQGGRKAMSLPGTPAAGARTGKKEKEDE